MKETLKNLILEFDTNISKIKDLTISMESLVKKILQSKKIKFHLITSRTKKKDSFIKKISNPDKNYKDISDITDISGIRIITYLENEVDVVAKLIEKEFEFDITNSVDKRKKHNIESFGYLSLHYVCRISNKRRNISKYRKLIDLPFEIQIRSILQHSWAEIEHDIGYKNSIPPDIKRSFSRVAGLLEIADKEFVELKNDIDQLTNFNKNRVLNDGNLIEFIKSNSMVKKTDRNIIKRNEKIKNLSLTINEADIFIEPLVSVKRLNHVGIYTLENLQSDLKKYQKYIPDFLRIYVDFSSIYGFDLSKGEIKYNVRKGYCIYFLPFIKILRSSEIEAIVYHKLKEFFHLYIINNPYENEYRIVKDLEFNKSIERQSKQMYKSYKKLNNA